MAAGIFGYLGYDMVRLMEELPPPNPDPIGIPDAVLVRPTIVVGVRCGEGDDHRGHAGAARTRRAAEPPTLRAGERLTAIVDASTRRSPSSADGEGRRRSRCRPTSNTTPDEYEHDGAARQGVHRRRRHLPGRAVAALRSAVPAPAVLALPRAAPREPRALPLFPRFRRLRHRRLQPGDPGARARRHRHGPPDRRHAAARRDTGTRTRRSRPSSWPIRRSAPST